MSTCWLNICIQFIALQTFYIDAPSKYCEAEEAKLVFFAVFSAATKASIVAYAAPDAT